MRLTIEVTEEQFQQIQSLAASNGQRIEDYIRDRALPTTEEKQLALEYLMALLEPRRAAAERGEVYEGTMDELLDEIHRRHDEQQGEQD